MKDNANSDTTTTAPGADLDMLKVAVEADAAMESPASETPGKTADAPQNGTPTGSGDSAKTTTKAEPSPTNPEKTDAAGKPETPKQGEGESPFTKAQKEKARREKTWQELEQEKAEFRATKAAVEAELIGLRREVADLRKSRTAPAAPARDAHGATADDYDKLAEDYKAEGRDDLAKAAKERAEGLRKQSAATSAPTERTDPMKDPVFQAEWKKNAAELMASDPELAKSAGESPLVRATNELLTNPQYAKFFTSHPDGLKAAVEVAKIMRSAHGAAELQKKITTLEDEAKKSKAEIERLNGLLQPRGSLPGSPPPEGGKKPEDMTDAEIMAAARAADRDG